MKMHEIVPILLKTKTTIAAICKDDHSGSLVLLQLTNMWHCLQKHKYFPIFYSTKLWNFFTPFFFLRKQNVQQIGLQPKRPIFLKVEDKGIFQWDLL